MARPKLLICAEGIVIDQQSNNASVFNILEQLNLRTLPAVWSKMVVMSLMEKDEGEPDVWSGSIRIILAGSEIMNQVIRHNFRGTKRSRNMLTISGLPITQPGIMEVSLCSEGESVMSYTIEVSVPEESTAAVPEA